MRLGHVGIEVHDLFALADLLFEDGMGAFDAERADAWVAERR